MNGKRPSADELLSRAASAMRLTPPPPEAMADALARTRAALAQANQGPETPGRAVRIWRTIMRHKKLTLSAAAAMLIAVGAATLFVVPAVTPSVAFGQVMENMSKVKTIHAKLVRKGKEGEIWAKRPNKVRMDLADGTYVISDGPTMWHVDPKADKAVKSASSFYEDARRRGRDVVDVLLNMPLDDDFSGFFSEKPVARQKRDGKTYDVYRMEMNLDGEKLSSVGLVDVRTHLLHSITVERRSGDKREIMFALTILSVDEPIPDGKFTFAPAKGMKVEQAKPRPQPAPATAPAGGAVMSGRITWAASGKPVGGARIRLSTPPVQRRSPLVARVTTDANGQWKATGVAAGMIQIDVRSWELAWPSVPTFKGNTGPAWRPAIVSDGRSSYTALDFKVYRPEEYCAKVSVRVTDENGKPVGALCYLVGPSSDRQQPVLGPRHSQFTDADGRIASDFIWPTDEPVRLSTHYKDYPSPYAAWAALSEPFIVNSKGSYDLNVVLPFARKLKLTVLDRAGKPAAGLLVWVSVGPEGWEALLLPQPGKKVTTANDGTALLDGLAPNAPANIALLRPNPDTKSGLPPVASTVVSVTGPTENVTGEKTVTFDDRPIRIEGTITAPGLGPDDQYATISARAEAVASLWNAHIAKGAFVLRGLPAGEVRLRYSCGAPPPAGRGTVEVECRNPLRLEPGHTYTVKVTGDRVSVIGAKE